MKKSDVFRNVGDWHGHRLALRRSGFSPKDFRFENLFGAIRDSQIPVELDLFALYPFIFNQGQEGSCGPHAIKWLNGMFCSRAGVAQPQEFGANFIYWVTRYLMGCVGKDDGCDNRSLLNAFLHYGICLESDCPYGGATLYAKPQREAFQRAMDFQLLGGYARLSTPDEACAAMAQDHSGVVVAVQVWESFYNIGVDGVVPYPNKKTERLLGLHDLASCGYSRTRGAIDVANSWDTTFGDHGKLHFPLDWTGFEEFWGVRGDECGVNDSSLQPGWFEMSLRRLRGMA